jgi:quercetin dioxygenase-like cupin family protein
MKQTRSPYHVRSADVPAVDMAPPAGKQSGKGGTLTAQMVFGSDTSIMIAERETGYHSKPHYHDAEQMNYVMDGSIWFFIGDSGFRAVKGDIVRIPRNAIHWAWVREPGNCVLFESHTPPLIGDEKMSKGAFSLLGPDEQRSDVKARENLWAPVDDMEAIEERSLAVHQE